MRHVHIPWLATMCGSAALLVGFAVFLSAPVTTSFTASDFSAAVAESSTPISTNPIVGIVLGASTDFSNPPSPLNCLSPLYFAASTVLNGITTSSLCMPTMRLAIIGVSNGSTNEINYLDEIGGPRTHTVCTGRTLGICRTRKQVLDSANSWQQTTTNGNIASTVISPGKTATLQWVFQPSQNVGWLQGKSSVFGFNSYDDVDFANLNYANQTSGTWQSWAGSGTFTAGPTAGNASVTPIDTTTYTVQGKYSNSNTGAIKGIVYVDRPVLTLTASPSSVASGVKFSLNWEAHNVTQGSCSITNDSSLVIGSALNASSESGTVSAGPIQRDTVFTIKCLRYTGTIASVSVTVPLAGVCATSPQATGCYISATSPVLEGASSTISWGCQSIAEDNAYKVEQQVSSGAWSTVKQGNLTSNTGTIAIKNVFTSTPYRLTCSPSGRQGSTTVVTLPPDLSSFQASPAQVSSGKTSKLFWNATNVVANSCKVSGPGISTYAGNTNPAGGLSTAAITKSTTYTLTCATPASQAGRAAPKVTATVQVSVACATTATPGSCYFFAKPPVISSGASSTLTWQCQSGDVTANIKGDNGYVGGGSWANTASVSPTSTTNYSMLCSPSGAMGSTSVQIYALNISASPDSIRAGNKTSVTWSAGGVVANSCRVSGSNGDILTSSATSGTKTTVSLTQPTKYTLSCTSATGGGTLTKTVLVDVIPAYQEI